MLKIPYGFGFPKLCFHDNNIHIACCIGLEQSPSLACTQHLLLWFRVSLFTLCGYTTFQMETCVQADKESKQTFCNNEVLNFSVLYDLEVMLYSCPTSERDMLPCCQVLLSAVTHNHYLNASFLSCFKCMYLCVYLFHSTCRKLGRNQLGITYNNACIHASLGRRIHLPFKYKSAHRMYIMILAYYTSCIVQLLLVDLR